MASKVIQIPEEIANSKEYRKLEKQMGEENCREFFQRSTEDLRATIAECEIQEQEATKQTESNADYRAAAETVKDFKSALNDALKPLRLKKKAAAVVVTYRKQLKTETPAQ